MDILSQNNKLNHKQPEIESIKSLISKCPLVLDINDPDVITVGNYYLPYSTGFEVECLKKETFNLEAFTSIPNIMEVNIDDSEQRFRIPSGIIGLNCLYNISMQLYINSVPTDSGIHYHIDFSDVYDVLTEKLLENHEKWILKELDTWEYKGSYNSRNCSIAGGAYWVRFQSYFKTMEIRIGEMTFNYNRLFDRIIHANNIAHKLKSALILDSIKETNPSALYEEEQNIINILKNRKKQI